MIIITLSRNYCVSSETVKTRRNEIVIFRLICSLYLSFSPCLSTLLKLTVTLKYEKRLMDMIEFLVPSSAENSFFLVMQ